MIQTSVDKEIQQVFIPFKSKYLSPDLHEYEGPREQPLYFFNINLHARRL